MKIRRLVTSCQGWAGLAWSARPVLEDFSLFLDAAHAGKGVSDPNHKQVDPTS